MLQQVRVICIFVLFTAMNMLAMDNGNDLFVEATNNKEKIELPLSVPFKQQIVHLFSDSVNTYPLAFSQSQEPSITNYFIKGKPVAQFLQIGDRMHFESKHQKPYDFLLHNSFEAGSFTLVTPGNFTFQKPVDVEFASLACKSLNFLDTFSSKEGLVINVNDCDSFSDVSCKNIFFEGDHLNLKLNSTLKMGGVARLLVNNNLLNQGTISSGLDTFMNASLFENKGCIDINKNLYFQGDKVLNNGEMVIGDSFSGLCHIFDHRGGFRIYNDCIIKKVDDLSTEKGSYWHVGRDWKTYANQFCLNGTASAGCSVLFNVDTHGIFGADLNSPFIHVNSKDRITCSLFSKLTASHYIGLQAQGLIQCWGGFLKKSWEVEKLQKYTNSFGAIPFSEGIFLNSQNGDIQRFGTVVAANGTVNFDAHKDLMIGGLTEVGSAEDSALTMNAQNIYLENSSRVISPNMNAKEAGTFQNTGEITIAEMLLAYAKFVNNSGLISSNNAHIKADRYWWNKMTGKVKIKNNFTIDALASFNTLGLIQAHDFIVNAGIDFNFLGISAAHNTNVSAFTGINAGLVLPQCSTSDILSRDSAFKVGEYFFSRCFPVPGLFYSLAKNAGGLFSQSKALFGQMYGLYRQKDMGASDWVALASSTKNLFKSALQTVHKGQQGYQIYSNPVLNNSSDVAPINLKQNILGTLSDIGSVVGPQYSRETFFDSNRGVVLGVNGNSTSFYDSNNSFSLFCNKSLSENSSHSKKPIRTS